MRDKERERWIDGVKGIAIILVVLGHVLDGYIGANMYADSQNILKNLSYIIKIFHMPLFIIISGYLYEKYVLYSSNINKKIANFMLMYFIWNFIWWVFKLSFSRYTPVFDSCKTKKSLYPLILLGFSDFLRCFRI